MDIYRQVEKRSGASGWRRKWSGKEERGGRRGEIRRSGERRRWRWEIWSWGAERGGGVGKFKDGAERGEGGVGKLKDGAEYTATNYYI